MTASPWQAALGERFAQLDPGLRAYFGALAVGEVGRGDGVFEVVGTPRRWLWPVLAVLALERMVWPVWQHDVPFSVANRNEGGVLRGERTFRFAGGERTMLDAITAEGGRIVDLLGRHGRWRVALSRP